MPSRGGNEPGPRDRALGPWNKTDCPFDRSARVEVMIEDRAARQPDKVAAVSADGELTFGELDRLANRLAFHLASRGVGPGKFVLLGLRREFSVLIAMLATLKCGGAFIPVDPDEPRERLARIARLDDVTHVISDPSLADLFAEFELQNLLFDVTALRKMPDADPIAVDKQAGDVAYGIATSGSSGSPKTVIVTHRSVVNLIEWMGAEFGIGPEDRVLWVSPVSFDLSIFDLLGMVALGGSLRMVDAEKRRDPVACSDILMDERITLWNSTPALLKSVVPFLSGKVKRRGEGGLRTVFVSGDWVPLDLPGEMKTVFPDADFVSLGGATEATVWSNFFRVDRVDAEWTSIPYGRPMRNARYYVLDESLNPCAPNEDGELFIAGACLAAGYLGDPELTRERFLADPFSGDGGARMYRTGDRARIWDDGTIELLGRIDDQVKISGYRVDLGDVEAALKRLGLRQCVAVAVPGISGTSRLVAAGVTGPELDLDDDWRSRLRDWLPGHMVPDELRFMESLPLTSNGKVDRQAVAALFLGDAKPSSRHVRAIGKQPPSNRPSLDGLKAFLRSEIAELRPGEEMAFSDDDPLGNVGLGSLDFANLSGRLFQEFGLRVSPVEFYDGGTINAFSKAVLAAWDTDPSSAVAPPDPASPAPENDYAEPEDDDAEKVAIIGIAARVPGAADADEFWDALAGGDTAFGRPPEAPRRSLSGEAGVTGAFLEDIDCFDAKFFDITPREAEAMDPRQRLLLEAAWTAVEDGGDDPGSLAGTRTGVFIGATGDDFSRLAHRDPDNIQAHTLTGLAPSVLANRISFALNLRGPSECIDTACSSSLVALHRAVASIAHGDCDAALVGGVSLMLDWTTHASLDRIGMLSPSGICRTFDARADGYVRGEGVGAVYLKRVEAARANGNPIHAVILGSAVNHGGRGVSLTAPTPSGQSAVIREAIESAGIDPATIGMVEAHGTGTSLGDPIEVRGLKDAFAEVAAKNGFDTPGARHCAIGSVKANIGHLEAAAGIIGLIKAVLSVGRGRVPPLPSFERLNEEISLDKSPFFIPDVCIPWPSAGDRRRAAVSSFGFGGANAHVIVECPPRSRHAPALPRGEEKPSVIAVSACTETALRRYAGIYARYFARLIDDGAGDHVLGVIGETSRDGRSSFEHRFACIASTFDDARAAFRDLADGRLSPGLCMPGQCDASLETAARRWVEGETDDWPPVRGGSPVRLRIPTYPFDRTRYWPRWLAAEGRRPAHPSTSEPEGSRTIDFSPYAPFADDHRIHGQAYIPGAVFIHVMHDVARTLIGGSEVRLKNLRMRANIENSILPETLRVRWAKAESGYKIRLAESDSGAEYCRAIVMPFDGATAKETLPETRDPDLGPEGFYALLGNYGIAPGPSLRVVERVYRSHGGRTGKLAADRGRHPSGAALIDGAFQLALFHQIETDAPAGLPVPVAIDEIRYHRPLPRGGWASVTSEDDPGSSGTLLKSDLTVFDSEGRVCLDLSGVSAILHSGPARSEQPRQVGFFAREWGGGPERAPPDDGSPNPGPPLAFGFGKDIDELTGAGMAAAVEGQAAALEPAADVARAFDRYRAVYGRTPPVSIVNIGDEDWRRSLEKLARISGYLVRRPPEAPVKLITVHLIDDDLSLVNALGQAAGAFCRSLRIENPDIVASSIGLKATPGASWAQGPVLEALKSLCNADTLPAEARLDVSRARLSVPDVMPVVDPSPPDLSPMAGGVYLVTGGLGALGRCIADHLTAHHQGKVMLCGRAPLDRDGEAFLSNLRRAGREIAYLPADVTDRSQVRRALARIRETFGALNGVVHCAGVLRDGLLARSSERDLIDVVAPKVAGAVHLDLETQDDDLDFFAVFSSLVSAMGNAGQTGYAFANGWLNGFARVRDARRRAGRRAGRTVAIGWGPWRDGSMRIPEPVFERVHSPAGVKPITNSAGGAAFVRALGMRRPSLLAIAGDQEKVARWLRRRPDETDGLDNRSDKDPASATAGASGEVEAAVTDMILDALVAESGLAPDDIDAHSPFEDYGIDSALVLALTERLEDRLGPLPKTLFFQYRTVSSLASHLSEKYADQLSEVGEKKDAAEEDPEKDTSEEEASVPASSPPVSATRGSRRDAADIAIIGMDARFPKADSAEAFWNNLAQGLDCVTEVPPERWDHQLVAPPGDPGFGPDTGFRWGGFINDAYAFDPRFFKVSQREAEMTDPQERQFLMSAYRCLENAGYPGQSLAGREVGVFAGVMWGQYEMWGLERGNAASSYASIANRVSYCFDFTGPSMAIDTMCSSSLTAIHLACVSLRSGESRAAIAGGVNINAHPNKHFFLCKRRFASPDGRCRAFGAEGDGYVPAEGVGTLLMKTRSAAERDGDEILGIIRGTAVNHGGRANGYTVPSPQAQTDVVRAALAEAGVPAESISYVEAHGTGTSLGDPIEVAALANAFGLGDSAPGSCALGSVKSNIGHAESAAGVAGVIKVLLQIRHAMLAPSIHCEPINPNIDFAGTPFYVPRKLSRWSAPDGGPLRAGVSSFGATGANAHVILEAPSTAGPATRPPTTRQVDGARHVVPLSAQTPRQLSEYIRALQHWLRERSPGNEEEQGLVLDAGDHPTDDQVLTETLRSIAEALDIDRRLVSPDDRFGDYGLSPERRAAIEGAISEKFGLGPDRPSLDEHGSPARLAAWLSHRAGPAGGPVPPEPQIGDIAYTLQTGRELMSERITFLAYSTEELRDLLEMASEADWSDSRIIRGTVDGVPDGEGQSPSEREFIAGLADAGKTEKLAELWCQGVPLDWTVMTPRGSRRRLDLPGYPFARVHCCVADPTLIVRGRAGPPHSLIDSVDFARSASTGLTFRKAVSSNSKALHLSPEDGNTHVRLEYLLAVATAALQLITPDGALEIEEIAWRPAPVSTLSVQELLVRLTPLGDGRHQARLFLDSDQEHVLASLVGRKASAVGDGLSDWPALADGCTPDFAQSEAASRFDGSGLRLWGGRSDPIHGADRVLVFEAQEPVGSADDPRGGEPWSALRGIFRAVALALGDGGDPVAHLDRFGVYGDVPKGGRVVVAVREDTAQAAPMGPAGDVCLELSGLSLQPGRREAPDVQASADVRETIFFPQAIEWSDVAGALTTPTGEHKSPRAAVIEGPGAQFLGRSVSASLGASLVDRLAVEAVPDLGKLQEWIEAVPDLEELIYVVGGPNIVLGPRDCLSGLKEALWPLLAFAKVLEARGPSGGRSGGGPALRLMTLGAHRTENEPINPVAAAVAALARSIAKEHRSADISSIDLTAAAKAAEINASVNQALRILRDPDRPATITALRGGRLYSPHLAPMSAGRGNGHTVFSEGDCFVIVGGSGAVGRQLSEALAERFGARIHWFGRRERLPGLSEAQKRIEGLGGRLSYHGADVTDPVQLQSAFDAVCSSGERIKAVFHCAMDFEIMRLAEGDPADLSKFIKAKTIGTINLLETQDQYPVDHMVLMSSAEVFAGNPGWGAYACACAFQDAVAQQCGPNMPGHLISIDWGYWDGSGRGNPSTLAAKGVYPIKAAKAVDALERLLHTDVIRCAAIDVGPAVLDKLGLSPPSDAVRRYSTPRPEAPATAQEKAEGPAGEENTRSDGAMRSVPPPSTPAQASLTAAPRAGHHDVAPPAAESELKTEERLKILLGQTLRIDPAEIESDTDLAVYGVDSITIVDFSVLIEEAFGQLPVEDIIDLTTVRAIAEYVDGLPATGPPVTDAGSRVKQDETCPDETLQEPDGGLTDQALAGPRDADGQGRDTVSERPSAAGGPRSPASAPPDGAGSLLLDYPRHFHRDEAATNETTTRGALNGSLQIRMVGPSPESATEVVSCGDGRPIICLPGIGLTAPIFHHQYDALTRDRRLLTIHAPGHGRSAPPAHASVDALVETLAETLALMKIEGPVDLIASCFGTVPALRLAHRMPERVRSLCLCGAFSEDEDLAAIPTEGLSAKDIADLTMAAAESLTRDFDGLMDAPENSRRRPQIESARKVLVASQLASPSVGMRYLNNVLSLQPSRWLSAIDAPTLFVTGVLDSVARPAASFSFGAMMPNARVVDIAGAGHYPFLTHPEIFNEALAAFLEGLEQ